MTKITKKARVFSTAQPAKERKNPIPGTKSLPPKEYQQNSQITDTNLFSVHESVVSWINQKQLYILS